MTAFPGWEDIAGLVRQIKFVHDHQGMIHRVAVVADDPLNTRASRMAEHFAQAEIRGFTGDQLDDAVAWAAGPAQ